MRALVLAAAIAVSTALGSVAAARGGTIYVASYGTDSPGCGAKSDPCRTLTRAISNAGLGDTVLVGPGRYGDVNGDGSFAGPDDETPDVGGCGCVVEVAKPVKVLSRDGAASTVIDADGKAGLHVVRISADGVEFGRKNHGFTLTGAAGGGSALYVSGSGNTVAGNVAASNVTDGFRIAGSGNTLSSNRATDDASGFAVQGSDNVFTDCVAARNTIGFDVGGGGNALKSVVAAANVLGIGLIGPGHTLTASSAIANRGCGVEVNVSGSPVITRANIFGNGTDIPVNCGLLVGDGLTAVATGTFWGAATGPGVDPSDEVRLGVGASATTTPFATREIKAVPKPLR